MRTLSVILITKNEAANIRDCLQSVSWANEIIVVDSGSTDDTVKLCKEMGAQVYVHDWPGFGKQKNRALGYATCDWVFSIDADERVTPELRASIETALRQPEGACVAYRVSRLSSFCGRFIRHSGWYPDHIVRLFRRNDGRFSDVPVHESIEVQGKTGMLHGELLHYSYADFEQVLDKLNQYSTAAAELQLERGKQGGLATALGHGIWSFMRTYFFRAGFLDGRAGFMLAVLNAEHSYYRYLKLMLLNEHAGDKP